VVRRQEEETKSNVRKQFRENKVLKRSNFNLEFQEIFFIYKADSWRLLAKIISHLLIIFSCYASNALVLQHIFCDSARIVSAPVMLKYTHDRSKWPRHLLLHINQRRAIPVRWKRSKGFGFDTSSNQPNGWVFPIKYNFLFNNLSVPTLWRGLFRKYDLQV
jgi:hypothetical protein